MLVGMVISDDSRHPTFGEFPGFYGLVRKKRDTSRFRASEPRPWLKPTIECRRGHRLQVPVGRDLQRIMDRSPVGQPIYLAKAPPVTPMKLRLEPIRRR